MSNASETCQHHPIKKVSCSKVYKTVEKLKQEAIDKFGNCLVSVRKQTVLDALGTCDVDQNNAFFMGAPRSALNDLIITIVNDLLQIRKRVKGAINREAAAPDFLFTFAAEKNKSTAVMALIPKLATGTLRKEIEKCVKHAVLTFISSAALGLNLSSDKSQKGRGNKVPEKRNRRCKPSSRTCERNTWLLKRSLRDTVILLQISEASLEKNDHAPGLKFLHATDSHFCHLLNDKTYRKINKSHLCNGKMAARTASYYKRIKTVMKAYEPYSKRLITVRRFSSQFQRACDSDKVSGGMAL